MELIDYNTLKDIERGDGYTFGKFCNKTKTSLKYLENEELCGKFEGVDIFLNALTDTSLAKGKYGNEFNVVIGSKLLREDQIEKIWTNSRESSKR